MKRLFLCVVCLLIASGLPAQESSRDEAAAIAVLEKIDLSKATEEELFNASSACRLLTRIGTEKSVDALEKLLDDERTRDYARTALQGIQRGIGGEKAEAALKRHPARKDNASPVDKKLEELRPQIEQIYLGSVKGLELFSKLLRSEDQTEFHAALRGFRRCPSREIVDRLAVEQTSLKPERRVAAILSLLDRRDAVPLPAEIVETAKSDENAEVQAAAIAVLGAFADTKNISVLFDALAVENETVSQAACEALTTAELPEIDKKIIDLLVSSKEETRFAACILIGNRRIPEARNRLWELQKNTDKLLQAAMLDAFGRIADQDGFVKLLDLCADPSSIWGAAGAFSGLKESCKIAPDRSVYARLIAEKLPDPAAKLELLAELGGDEALKSIADIAKTTDRDEVRDQATKILGEWTGAEVAPVLLDLSASLAGEKYKVRTFRGFLRAVRQFDLSREEKRILCEKALDAAPRDEEKKLVREQLDLLK